MLHDLGLSVARVNPVELPDEDLPAALQFSNVLRRERDPDEPPATLEEFASRLRNKPAFVEVNSWLVRETEGERCFVARADLVFHHTGQNEHTAHLKVDVLPEYRRRGIASRLLPGIVALARERGKSLLMTHSDGRIPAGEAFLSRTGAEKALESVVSHLNLAAVDRDLLAAWQANDAFEVGWWDGAYPEAELGPITDLYNALFADVPQGDLRLDSPRFTPEQIRQFERDMAARGNVRWVAWARERATGAYAGLTETLWNRHRPHRVDQRLTGVLGDFRQRGVARLLKAAMVERILVERPGVRYVRTDNAETNAAMLSINRALGFRSAYAEVMWQVPVERVEAYLRGSGAAPSR